MRGGCELLSDDTEPTMNKIPLSLWLTLAVVWIPFPCLFLPMTLMIEGGDPWYIGYTTVLFFLAMFFYMPANFFAAQIPYWCFETAPSTFAIAIAAFLQSLLLTHHFLKAGRSKPVECDSDLSTS